MALPQADFYAYSRATGAPVPRDPEEQAQMAPAVLEFRRNQLKATEPQQQQGFNLTQALGVGAALAGAGAAGFGLSRLLRQKPTVVGKVSVVRPATIDIEAPVRRVATEYKTSPVAAPEVPPSRIPDPWGATTAPPRQAAQGFSPRQYAESTGSLESRMPSRIVMQNPNIVRGATRWERVPTADLTTVQDSLLGQTKNQLINAVESGEDQITGRFNHRVQQNEDIDRSAPVLNLEDGIPADQTQSTISDPWGKPTFVPPQPVAETPAARLLPPTVVSKRQEAQDFLAQQRQKLSALSPGRRERVLAQTPEVAEAMELYASTGDPNVLSRLSSTPSSPLQVRPVTQTEIGSETLPMGKFFQPTGRNEFVEDLLEKDINLTNKISGLGARKQQIQNRLQEIDETEPMLRYAMAGEREEGGAYSKMFNTLQAEKQNLPDPESFNADIGDALAERNFVRQRLESAQNLGSTYKMLNRQEGVRPFFETTAEGEIIPETLEIRTGRPTIDTEPRSGGGRTFSAYDPEAASKSSVGIYGIEPRDFPIADPGMKPTMLLPEEKKAVLRRKPESGPALQEYIDKTRRMSRATPEQRTSSLEVSEALRRANIEGRDPNMVLRSLGFNL
jgi:hypothetical protein